ncbi:MAG: class I SAM-dependent methyltransferase [Anaerolineales bacterium]
MNKGFYDSLAPYYKLVYEDWEKSVETQARDLDSLIKEYIGDKRRLLDVSCGIGTQCIGLAALGYEVSASDISSEAVNLAKVEAEKRSLRINFKIADMRDVSTSWKGKFDIILSGDNSVPHLLTGEELLRAFRGFFDALRPGGGVMVTIRDYRNINPENRSYILNPRRVHYVQGTKIVLFDLWEFEGKYYNLTMYIIRDDEKADLETISLRTRYYCLTPDQLAGMMEKAGFTDVQVLEERFFQPVIIGIRQP